MPSTPMPVAMATTMGATLNITMADDLSEQLVAIRKRITRGL